MAIGIVMRMAHVIINMPGPFPEAKQGNKYLLAVTDWFTKYVEALVMKNQDAKTPTKVVVSFFLILKVTYLQVFFTALESRKTHKIPFQSQSDGQSERYIKTLRRKKTI